MELLKEMSEYALKDSCLKYSLKGASIEYQTLIFYFISPNDKEFFNNNILSIKTNLREFWKAHVKDIKQNGIYFTDVIAKLAQKEPKKQMDRDLANLFDKLRETLKARDER